MFSALETFVIIALYKLIFTIPYHTINLTENCHFDTTTVLFYRGGSVAEWLACWTQAQKGPGSNRSRDAVE